MKTSARLFFFILSFLSISFAAAVACPTLGCAAGVGESAFGEASADGGLEGGEPDVAASAEDAAPEPDPSSVTDPAPTDETDDGDGGAAPSDDGAATSVQAEAGVSPASPPEPPFDAGEAGVCPNAIASGDLIIVELMIESTAGTGDHGEWVEVQSTLDCAVDLIGLSGTAPTGAKVVTFEIDDDVWIPAHGTFLVADSTDPAVNHDLPGMVVPWSGQPGDVLRNEGATVTLLMNSDIVDSVTSPALKLTPGVSVAFPRDCALDERTTWAAWQPSIASWFPEFRGTPNAPNDDVQCPALWDD